MLNAKDTFYLMLRDRLTALNPTRTVSVRGVSRPGILVEENELATTEIVPDLFRLHWTTLTVDVLGPMPLVTMTCEIRYATQGSTGSAGMDRGRLLTTMDAELSTALRATPHNIQKQAYASTPPTALSTNIFWSDAIFAPATITSEQIARTATVEVFAYEEPGE